MINVMDYTIKYSKASEPVPVVNGVHLHSIYNPQKEAETYLEKYKSIVDEKSHILIFGLGFGYHWKELNKYIKKQNLKTQIIVIEPNINVFKDYLKILNNRDRLNESAQFGQIRISENTICYAGQTAQSLYEDKSFIEFLCNRPGILQHPVSFNLYQDYFKQILKYSAEQTNEQIAQKSKYNFIKNGLSHFNPTDTWDEIISKNKMNTKENIRFEVLLRSFESIN